MAAEVHAPRMARATTNMEDAANAARQRDQLAFADIDHVDPDLIDNSLSDMIVGSTFIDAADNFLDEIRRWVRPDGCEPNAVLCKEVDKAQTLLAEAGDKLAEADVRLRTALDHAFALRRRLPLERPSQHSFARAMHCYRTSYLTAQGFYLLNYPGDDGDLAKFERAFDEHVSVVRSCAIAVLMTAASSSADMADKLAVIEQQEAHNWQGDEVAAYTRQLIADAIVLAGGAA